MTFYKHPILPLALIGGAAAGSAFAYLVMRQLCKKHPEPSPRAAVSDWEGEGGSVTPPRPAVPPGR